ncbi:MAG: exodeoxyribonuclease VII large subunit [Anaerolineales bacterium]|nr:exodeoxyribonuclease VII large subunit [Anaerolineales bacterium]
MRQSVLPGDGEAVEVHGSLGVYEASGNYQLYADLIRPAGEGALYQEFLRLKARLEEEGLFAVERKRPIPRWPKTIGIVTSPTGAALRDMLNTLRRRYPLARVILAPTAVQGEEAPAGIVEALARLNQIVQPDVILLARGGGSIEDLWAFNDERVARAIVTSPAPVITGVGHETDFTIADFAADLRAPTPTAAAELASPDQADLRLGLEESRKRMDRSVISSIQTQNWVLVAFRHRLNLSTPLARIRRDRQRMDELSRRAQEAQRARDAEALDALAAENANRDAFRFGALIGDRVEQQWIRPPGSSRGLECTLELRLEPTGDVVEGSVRVVSGSGSAAFDGSAIAAVYKASPLPVPSGQAFELLRHFRFKFRP